MKDTGWKFQGYRVLESENAPDPNRIKHTGTPKERTMTDKDFNEADLTDYARAEAETRWPQRRASHYAQQLAFVAGAEWARTHLAAQEPTDAEVEAAARAIHINTIREFDDLGGLDQHALRTRARKALSAARAARRDEEKRDG